MDGVLNAQDGKRWQSNFLQGLGNLRHWRSNEVQGTFARFPFLNFTNAVCEGYVPEQCDRAPLETAGRKCSDINSRNKQLNEKGREDQDGG